MILHRIFITAALLFSASWVDSQTPDTQNYKPPQGYVPDAATAIRIAVAVWEPIYGVKQISSQKPYEAVLANGIWKVRGSLPKNAIGGVAEAEIAKEDARILRVIHGQ